MSDSPQQPIISDALADDEGITATRGHGDYVQISIDNRTGTELGISNATLSSGKFHAVGDNQRDHHCRWRNRRYLLLWTQQRVCWHRGKLLDHGSQ